MICISSATCEAVFKYAADSASSLTAVFKYAADSASSLTDLLTIDSFSTIWSFAVQTTLSLRDLMSRNASRYFASVSIMGSWDKSEVVQM